MHGNEINDIEIKLHTPEIKMNMWTSNCFCMIIPITKTFITDMQLIKRQQ